MKICKRLAILGSIVFATAGIAAHAADLTVTAFGGVWEQNYRECFVQPFEAKTGKKVDVVVGSPIQFVNQIAANPGKPPIDVFVGLVDSGLMLKEKGLVDPITVKEVPNLAQLRPEMVAYGEGYGFPITNGGFGLMYSKSRVKNPPKTWQEFVEGTVRGDWHATLPGISYLATVQGLMGLFAKLYGGSVDNVQPGLDQVKRMLDSGHVSFYNEPNSPLVAMKSGDTDIVMFLSGRAWAEHDNNPDIAYLDPKPGAVAFVSMVQKIKNGSPLGFEFMNMLASAEGETCFANKMGYGVPNKNVKYSASVQPFVEEDASTLIFMPFADIARNTPKWVELWNKQIGR
jgi:putative spermidine/putrescine transport system substrate-binding protein